MKALACVVALASFFTVAFCSRDLASIYRFNVTLVPDSYWLHWNFNKATQTITFAVRVKTTGWIGFGLSPNGQMPGSDVVIGWIDGPNSYFHDRYAFTRSTPSIDPVQNWFLTNAEQQNGYSVLEFYRNFTTCDDRDLDVLYETARVVYSWNNQKPTLSSDGTYNFIRHTNFGSRHVNLLGGNPDPPSIASDAQTFTVRTNQARVPDTGTTYWCEAMRLPSSVLQREKYIVKFSPNITIGSEPHVHHMLLYTCDGLQESDLGPGGDCFDGSVSSRVTACTTQSVLLAAWSVGGSDFIYPENVAYPIGGPGNSQFVVIEIHYNNPHLRSDIIDSSGLIFTYVDTPRQHNAGVMVLGHEVDYKMVIPPNASNFTVTALCSDMCSKQNFPPGGIHIIGNMLHTHYTGIGLALRRVNQVSCDGVSHYQELKPVDKNLHYDFNFQQTTHLPQEITVLPGETLILECYYNTSGRNEVTMGGLSTQEEMCLSMLVYYPKLENEFCISTPVYNKFDEFIEQHVPNQHHEAFNNLIPERSPRSAFETVFGLLEWNETQIDGFQQLIYAQGNHHISCPMQYTNTTPSISCCSYETTNTCTGYEPAPCCQRECVIGDREVGSSASTLYFSIVLTFTMTILVVLMF